MKHPCALAAALLLAAGHGLAADFNAADYGARGDGTTKNTAAIQKAIDAAAGKGGTVVFPAGTYLTGAIFVKSGVTLKLDKGVTLLGSRDIADYPQLPTRIAGIEMTATSALVNVYHEKHAAIVGEGTIDGDGKVFWDNYWALRKGYEPRGLRWASDYDAQRPRLVQVYDAADVKVGGGLLLRRAGFWTVHVCYSTDIVVDGVTIRNNDDGKGPSTDGIDIDSSNQVLVAHADIAVNDDALVLKAGRDADGLRVGRPTEDVVLRDIVVRESKGGITFGSETSGGFRNIEAYNLAFDEKTPVGILFKSAHTRGGWGEDLRIHDVTMKGTPVVMRVNMNWNPNYSNAIIPTGMTNVPAHWKVMATPVPESQGIARFHDVRIWNIKASGAKTAFEVAAYPDVPLQRFRFDALDIEAASGGHIDDAREWTFTNTTLRFTTPLDVGAAGSVTGLPAGAFRIRTPAAPIDRHAIVERHNPHLRAIDTMAPLSVGNGRFAFTADVTGLQTLPNTYHDQGTPTETQARWSWHEAPNPNGYKLSDTNREYTSWGRTVGYPMNTKSPAGQWLRENPHIQPLPQIGFVLAGAGAHPLTPADVTAVDQKLDMWKGQLDSRVTLLGQPVTVTSAVSPDSDTLALRIRSPLLASGRVAVRIALPYGYAMGDHHNPPLDWSHADGHQTTVLEQTDRKLVVEHRRDAARYAMTLAASSPLRISHKGAHVFEIAPQSGDTLEVTIAFVQDGTAPARLAADVFAASSQHWDAFWKSGAAVDFSGSTDPRAAELERRVVLSQYLTAIQLGDEIPASESGLTTSTWYGKHHTEMVWWHTAHFALWGRPEFTARTLEWFRRALPAARAVAAERGLQGTRWMKMTGPGGRESPGGNPLIVWNQPHVIHLAELMYRANPSRAILARYRDLVLETAAAMSSMLHWDEQGQRYVLGPPLWIAQEIYDQGTSMNPTYELSYWARGLEIAQEWRERLGLKRDPEWERRRTRLSALPQKDGKYVALETHPDTWDKVDSRHDHPSFLMALGQLPGDGVDREVMRSTLKAVLSTWDFKTKIWGWDYPMIAMTAARLGETQAAVDVLLKSDGPNNGYTQAGHNVNTRLPVYLPGNGALLAAVAMMAGGWDGAPSRPAPGFPADGRWVVRAEGFQRLP